MRFHKIVRRADHPRRADQSAPTGVRMILFMFIIGPHAHPLALFGWSHCCFATDPPALPILKIEPALPILKMLPTLPILRILPLLPMLRMLPALPILRILKALKILRTLIKLN